MMKSGIVLMCVLLSGCSGLTVERESAETATAKRLPGLPFYVKEAVLIQQTKVAHIDLLITFQVSDSYDFSKSTVLPSAGPARIRQTKENDDNVRQKLSLVTVEEPFKTRAQAEAAVASVLKQLEEDTAPYQEVVLSNTWKVDTVLSPKRYYITNRVPAFGSASAEFDLAPDGTLTKASASITDDTAKSILALSPVTSVLDAVAKGIAPSTEAAASLKYRDRHQASLKPTSAFHVRFTIQAVPTVYTLQKFSLMSHVL